MTEHEFAPAGSLIESGMILSVKKISTDKTTPKNKLAWYSHRVLLHDGRVSTMYSCKLFPISIISFR